MTATVHRLQVRPTSKPKSPKSLTLAEINAIPVPSTGNRVHYLTGAVVQGAEVPKGFGVRVTAAGNRSFVLSYRAGGKDRRLTVGEVGTWSVPDAVKEARRLRRQIDLGVDPLATRQPPPAPQGLRTVGDMIADYVAHGLTDLRRPDIPTDALTRLLAPEIGKIPLLELRRSHLMPALDRIEAAVRAGKRGSGKTTKARVLSYFSAAWTWEMKRNDDLPNIFVRGMATVKEPERPGGALPDEEIRRLWAAWDGPFGDVCKVLLLTGQRRAEVSGMRWDEIDTEGSLWTIPATRYKTGREHVVPLSEPVQAILQQQPRGAPTVFRTKRGAPISRGGYYKADTDKRLAQPIDWVIHDLRRTARSLMARLGIPQELAERVIGHTQDRLIATYDRHDYLAEKRAALDKLAGSILRIVAQRPRLESS